MTEQSYWRIYTEQEALNPNPAAAPGSTFTGNVERLLEILANRMIAITGKASVMDNPDVALNTVLSEFAKRITAGDLIDDYVATGLLPAVPASSLTATIPAGVAYVGGSRWSLASASRTFTAARDTYADLTNAGTIAYSEVANGATAPAIPAGATRLFRVVTDANVAQVNTVGVGTVTSAAAYTTTINGVAVTYTSDVDATAGEIAIGLRDAINASTNASVTPVSAATAALATDTTASLTITAKVAGVPFTLTVTANLTNTATTANNTAKITAITDLRDRDPNVRGSIHSIISAAHSDVDTTTSKVTGNVLTWDTDKFRLLPAGAASVPLADTTTHGRVKLKTAAVTAGDPIVPGDNDPRLSPATAAQNGLLGTVDKTKLDGISTAAREFVSKIGEGILIFNNSSFAAGSGVVSADLRGLGGIPTDAKGVYIQIGGGTDPSTFHVDSADSPNVQSNSLRYTKHGGAYFSAPLLVTLGTGVNAGKVRLSSPQAQSGLFVFAHGWWR